MENKVTVTRNKMEHLLDSAQLALKGAKKNEWGPHARRPGQEQQGQNRQPAKVEAGRRAEQPRRLVAREGRQVWRQAEGGREAA